MKKTLTTITHVNKHQFQTLISYNITLTISNPFITILLHAHQFPPKSQELELVPYFEPYHLLNDNVL